MKNYQFLIIAGFLSAITSNTENSPTMEVAFGLLAPTLMALGVYGQPKRARKRRERKEKEKS